MVMGKRGPKPGRADGFHFTRSGYLRGRHGDRLVMQHRIVWEAAHGPIPAKMSVHHVNGNPGDNRLENLALVDAATHKRLHGGCELRDGVWWKPCLGCGEIKPVDREHWYLTKEGWPNYGRCRKCHIRRVVADKQARRAGVK